MTSRFVAAGQVDGNAPGGPQAAQQEDGRKEAPKNAQWEAAKRQLEEERKQREEQRVKAASGEEKSLYDILQANKGKSVNCRGVEDVLPVTAITAGLAAAGT